MDVAVVHETIGGVVGCIPGDGGSRMDRRREVRIASSTMGLVGRDLQASVFGGPPPRPKAPFGNTGRGFLRSGRNAPKK